MPLPGYVYAIVTLERPWRVKIGKAANPHKRLLELRPGSPVRLGLHSESWHEDCNLAEREVHIELAHARVVGEWFDMGIWEVDQWLARRECVEFMPSDPAPEDVEPRPTLIDWVVATRRAVA